MNSSLILSIITFVYGLAGFLYIFAWIFKKQTVSKAATWVALIGLAGRCDAIDRFYRACRNDLIKIYFLR